MRKENELNQIFEKDFGKLPNEIFKEFDTTPIAAASIAQVTYKCVPYELMGISVEISRYLKQKPKMMKR